MANVAAFYSGEADKAVREREVAALKAELQLAPRLRALLKRLVED